VSKLCQWPSCDNDAVWQIKSSQDNGVFLACVEHRGKVCDGFKKLTGENPELRIVTPVPSR
jgi:hypothetical protein